jgi:RNA polymerase sigma-70 factor (ECF subfamily)
MAANGIETEQLLDRVVAGDGRARQRVLERHRARLRRMVAVHLDRRVAVRVDPSDVVQEALAEADRRLDDYARTRPIPLYPWMRQFARERVVQLHRHHLRHKRSIARERGPEELASDRSAVALAEHLAHPGTSPSARLIRAEDRDRVRAALLRLAPGDREVLVYRYLEQMTTAEVAAVLGIAEAAVKTRQRRALERLRGLLEGDSGEDRP